MLRGLGEREADRLVDIVEMESTECVDTDLSRLEDCSYASSPSMSFFRPRSSSRFASILSAMPSLWSVLALFFFFVFYSFESMSLERQVCPIKKDVRLEQSVWIFR